MKRLALLLVLLAGCGNPSIDEPVDALPDDPLHHNGPEHRPGQPCLLCHGAYGGRHPELAVAGTIFGVPEADGKTPLGVEGVVVTVTDSFGDTKTKKTNCSGNFYWTTDEWQPGFPLAAKIEYPTPGGSGKTPAYMSTRIGREGSCSECHKGARADDSPGIIYCLDQPKSPFPAPQSTCGQGRGR